MEGGLSESESQLLETIRIVAKMEVQKALAEFQLLPRQQSAGPSAATGAAAIFAPLLLLCAQSALQSGIPQAAIGEFIKKGLNLTLGNVSEPQPTLPAPPASSPEEQSQQPSGV